MLTSEFDYHLPPELIAQQPVEPRDASRLLVVHRDDGRLEHRRFRDVLEYLRSGDLLVANESRVIPARLQARKVPSGGRVELLLLARRDARRWEALVKGRRAAPGQRLALVDAAGQPGPEGRVVAVTEAGGRLVDFEEPLEGHLERLGTVPLPPYIHEPLEDPERYQTVYARVRGSVAAPTAGLHFTPELVRRARGMGIGWTSVVLHIGLDTFRPVTEEVVEAHKIHREHGALPEEAAGAVNHARREGGRVVAVGTTSVRVLETAARRAPGGTVEPWEGETDLFVYPPYRFRAVDALITNFHLPRSSLLMLVSAFAGVDLVRRAYEVAVAERYRFYSLGDAMLIL